MLELKKRNRLLEQEQENEILRRAVCLAGDMCRRWSSCRGDLQRFKLSKFGITDGERIRLPNGTGPMPTWLTPQWTSTRAGDPAFG